MKQPRGNIWFNNFPLKKIVDERLVILPSSNDVHQDWRHDIHHNGIILNDTQPRRSIRHNDTQHNHIQHNDIQYNDIQYNDIQYNDIQYNDIQYNDIQCNDIRHNGIHYNDIKHNHIHHNDTKHNHIHQNDIQYKDIVSLVCTIGHAKVENSA